MHSPKTYIPAEYVSWKVTVPSTPPSMLTSGTSIHKAHGNVRLFGQRPTVWRSSVTGYWGLRAPEGLIVIPDEFQIIVNYKESGYFILRDKAGRAGCVDKDFNCIFPCIYEWVSLREKVDELIANSKI